MAGSDGRMLHQPAFPGEKSGLSESACFPQILPGSCHTVLVNRPLRSFVRLTVAAPGRASQPQWQFRSHSSTPVRGGFSQAMEAQWEGTPSKSTILLMVAKRGQK